MMAVLSGAEPHSFFASASHILVRTASHSDVGTFFCSVQTALTAFVSSSAFSASLHTIGGMDGISLLEHSFLARASHTFSRPASHSAAGTLLCLEQAAATNFFSRSGFSASLQSISG